MAKMRKKTTCGVDVSSVDGLIWTWTVDGTMYTWCKMGQLRVISGGNERLVMFCRILDGAVGYTAGYHDAMNRAMRVREEAEGGKRQGE